MIGLRLGPYQVLDKLGEGGMGEVYRGRDTRLARVVALKFLPAEFASDAERLARFEHEARTLASLNHPHIAQIYGLEQSGETRALVMELVDGEDLSQRLQGGAISLNEALPIARQIVEALEAAHGQGIIHRDLKPANIKVRADGTVKVLDFGLAKVFAAKAEGLTEGSVSPADSPTIAVPGVTKHGVILGTVAYMSPEQARGRSVDTRTDVWAFGCVLFEMLTGRALFAADTATDILAAVVSREPDWSALPAATPPAIRRLLRRCLAKDVRQRLQSIGDARLELDEAREPEAPLPLTSARAPWGARIAWLAAGSAVTAAALFVADRWAAREPLDSPAVELQRLTNAVGHEEFPALSPDGKTVAFVAAAGGRRHIWVRLLSGGATLQLTRADADHQEPRWAPDSSALIYFTVGPTPNEPGTLWEIPALGGTPRRLLSSAGGGDLSHDGKRLAAFHAQDGEVTLITAARDGSDIQRVSVLPRGLIHSTPRWSPDDRSIAFMRSDTFQFDKQVQVIDAAGRTPPRVVARGDDLRGHAWLPDGSGVIYSSSQGSTVLYPPTYNLRLATLDGRSDRPITFGDISYIEPDVHPVAGITATRITNHSDVWRIPIAGTPQANVQASRRVTRQTGVAQVPSLGPDEKELVYLSDSGGHGNLWVAATDGSAVRQITFEQSASVAVGVPVWSPVNDEITFILTRGGTGRQWLIKGDGSEQRDFTDGLWAAWSPDGAWLYTVVARQDIFQIQKTPRAGGAPTAVRQDDASSPMPAADGTLYFCSPSRGRSGVIEWSVLKARPEGAAPATLAKISGARVPVDPNNIHPILSPDGKWLAQPLLDSGTTNLWLIDSETGAMRRITDFSDRPVIIARRVSWSRDSRHIYAAVAETDSDVVLLKNLLGSTGAASGDTR